MYGRYGSDTLAKVMLYVCLIWMIVANIVALFVDSVWFSVTYYLITTAMIAWMFFRMFSRNVTARKRENERFCGFFKLRRNKFRDRKTHVYRKCHACGAVLRLPKAKGKHFVVCPRCNKRFEVKG